MSEDQKSPIVPTLDEGEREKAFAMVWLHKGPYPAALIDHLNGYITGGSTRCLDALIEAGVDVMRRTTKEQSPPPSDREERMREALTQIAYGQYGPTFNVQQHARQALSALTPDNRSQEKGEANADPS